MHDIFSLYKCIVENVHELIVSRCMPFAYLVIPPVLKATIDAEKCVSSSFPFIRMATQSTIIRTKRSTKYYEKVSE